VTIIELTPSSLVTNGANNFAPVNSGTVPGAMTVDSTASRARTEPITEWIFSEVGLARVNLDNLPTLAPGVQVRRIRLVYRATAEIPDGVSPGWFNQMAIYLSVGDPNFLFEHKAVIPQDSANTVRTSPWFDRLQGRELTVARVNSLQVSFLFDNRNPIFGNMIWNQSFYNQGIRGSINYMRLQVELSEPPYAPNITFPRDNVVLNRQQAQRFAWEFGSPHPDERQSAFLFRWRRQGTSTWSYDSTWTQSPANHFEDSAGAWPVGDWEWAVRVRDSQGLGSPYSDSAFFTAVNPPPGPQINYPANNASIFEDEGYLAWSVPDQEAYQVRKVADASGQPDTGTVYYDSGTVDSSTRHAALSFPVNDRHEHLQVRVRHQSVWSPWSSTRILVSYTAPPIPTITVTPESQRGRVLVEVSNPAPGSQEPALEVNRIQRRPADGSEEWVTVAEVVNNGSWHDYTVASGVEYEYRVMARAGNGTSSTSEVHTATVNLRYLWLQKASAPHTARQFVYNESGGAESRSRNPGFVELAGRRLPFLELGEHLSMSVRGNVSLDGPDEVAYFREFADSGDLYLYRDSSGRKLYGIPNDVNITSRHFGGEATFEVVATDYDEAVV
jgi:hypothetical protein